MRPYCVFYHNTMLNEYYVYYSTNEYKILKELEAINRYENVKLTNKSITKSIQEGQDLCQILKAYCESILVWRNELLNCKTLKKKYDIFNDFANKKNDCFSTNEGNIYNFFDIYSSKYWRQEKFTPVQWYEYQIFEKTYNAGLYFVEKGIYNTIGYDFKMAYPTILASQIMIKNEIKPFDIAIHKGILKKYLTLPDCLDYGLYNVKIECEDARFLKIFNIKYDTNYYTHFDIKFCRKYKEKFNIKITLQTDCEYNALVYLPKCVTSSANVFKPWFDILVSLKKELPKNGLIKLFSSSIWGYLSKTNKRYYTEEEIANKKLVCSYDDKADAPYLILREKENRTDASKTDYMLIEKSNPCKMNFRLKPFITSFMRIVIAEIAIETSIEAIVRINTDNITFNKDKLSNDEIKRINEISHQFIQEEKTTGNFDIKSLNTFIRL